MNTVGKLFLKGLAVAIPLFLTIAILWWMAATAEHLLGGLLAWIMPAGWYVPGMGLVAGIAVLVLIGLLSHVLIVQRLFGFGERLVNRVPLVKTIYTAIKDFIAYLSPGGHQEFRRAVMVQVPGQSFQLIGFVTREHFDGLDLPLLSDDAIAVYLPMSYQIGGYTLYLPRSCMHPLDIPFEEAMRLALTGGVARRTSEPDAS